MMGVNVVGAQASNNNRPTPDVESSVQLEQTVDEFRNWKKEEAFKNILPKAHVSYNKKVTVVMVSDPVAWNVTNLRKPLDWSIPTDTVAPGAKVKAGIWINLFKSYVMKYMKEKVKSIFLKNFNSEKYRHLREDGNILMNYNEMCRVLTPLVSKSVRICLYLCMIEKFLNLNSHYCCFFREPQAWEFKFKEHDNIYIELSDKFMNEHKVRYKTDGNPTNGCIQILAKYAITIVRRDICPSLRVRSKKKSHNKKGIPQRRRNRVEEEFLKSYFGSGFNFRANRNRNRKIDDTKDAINTSKNYATVSIVINYLKFLPCRNRYIDPLGDLLSIAFIASSIFHL